jgi:hypothetical protein
MASRRLRDAERAVAVALALAFVVGCEGATRPDPIEAVELSPATSTLLVGPGGGERTQLAATVRRKAGGTASGVVLTWRSSNEAVATVNGTGLVQAVSRGTARITATVGSTFGLTNITVEPVPIGSLTIDEDSLALTFGVLGATSDTLHVTPRDSTGLRLESRLITWTSATPGIASVSPGFGVVTAVDSGATWVRASAEGRMDSVLVRVTRMDTLPDGADFDLVDADWTQAIQEADDRIPMIRGGMDAVVNVLISSNLANAAPSTVVLRLLDGASTLIYADTLDVVVPPGANPSRQAPTLQFLVPARVLRAGMLWEVLRDPDGDVRDSSREDDRFPRGAAGLLGVVDVPRLRVHFVPVMLTAHGNVTATVTAAMLDDYMRKVRAFYPVGEIEATVGPPLASAQNIGGPTSGGGDGFWIPLLAEMDAARLAASPDDGAYWVGVVLPPPGITYVSFSGYGYIPGNPASTGPYTRTSVLVQLDWFTDATFAHEVVPHELGHNFGRSHTPCGNPAGVDPGYPRTDGRIGPGAQDVASWAAGLTAGALSVSQDRGDIMGYCNPKWVSGYTYEGIRAYRDAGVVVALRASATTRARTLVVRGALANKQVRLDPAITLSLPVDATDGPGAWLAEARDATGRVLARAHFEPARVDHADRIHPFAVVLRLDAAAEASLAEIVVSGPAGTVARRVDAAALRLDEGLRPSARTVGRVVLVECPAPLTAAIALTDPATGALLASAMASSTVLGTAAPRTIQVACSDGVRTSTFPLALP